MWMYGGNQDRCWSLLQRFGSAVACHSGRGSGCSRPVASALLEEVTFKPTVEPLNRRPTNCRTIIPKKLLKLQDPQQISQPGDLAKGLRTLRGSGFGGQWDLITELAQDWRKQALGGHKQKLMCPRTQEKGAVTPQETDPDW